MDAASSKAALRATLRARRAALPPAEAAAAGSTIRRRASELLAGSGARRVLAYAAVGAEVDLGPLLMTLAADGTLVLPRVAGDALQLARVHDLGSLEPGWRGVLEPPASAEPVEPAEVELAFVPGLGFDVAGGRLGSGGGHFDRLLARCGRSTLVAGVAYSVQLVPEVPREVHDHPVDVVLTERGVHGPAAG